ncbi:MAG TPA: PIG-L family deacetylase [Candidatus Acidoferrum sp.]
MKGPAPLFLLSTVIAILSFCLFAGPSASAQFPPPPGTGPGLPETIEAIDAARVTTRILYITAHPDDESAAVLTYLARGLHADVALLSLTRGEGGQNDLGPEQAPQLGLIRTQELLAATRGYGVKLYFTRAKDFGFSKTPEETEKIWGDQVLEDMVRVIRTFRPNIVINNFGGVHGGHGHHQAAGLLTPKAVQLAADPKTYPDQLVGDVTAWGGSPTPTQILDIERGSEHPSGYILPLDDISPLWGKTWREIGIDAFANHRTQGITNFLGSPFLRRPMSLRPEDGSSFDPRSLSLGLSRIAGPNGCDQPSQLCDKLNSADCKILVARKLALDLHWVGAAAALKEALLIFGDLAPTSDTLPISDRLFRNAVVSANYKIYQAYLLAAGFEFTAQAERFYAVLGEPVKITLESHCRPGIDCTLGGPLISMAGTERLGDIQSDPTKGLSYQLTLKEGDSLTQDVGEPVPAIETATRICAQGKTFNPNESKLWYCTPVISIDASSTHVDRVGLKIVPAYVLSVEPPQAIEVLSRKHRPFDVFLHVHSYSVKAARVSAGLNVPSGWKVTPPVTLDFQGEGDQYAKLTVTPPSNLSAGNFTIGAYVKRGEEKFATSLEPLPTMPTILWSEPAQCLVHAFNINVPANLHVGYVTAENEPVPDALQRLGIQVDLLDATALAFGDLSRFKAIVVGIRAYELRPDLRAANQRLLDYVKNGGTLVVQYERDFAWDRASYAPYPAKIGNPTPRTTDENATVQFLKPDDPILNTPNKIMEADFHGWIQERGLYYWSQFDPQYTPLLSMHDPGEADLNGSLVYTRFGKGVYIYTGIAFFRQLPEGVPGAYRLFVNLLSASHFGTH